MHAHVTRLKRTIANTRACVAVACAGFTRADSMRFSMMLERCVAGPRSDRRIDRGGDGVDVEMTHVLVAADERRMPKIAVRRGTALLENALARIRPQRNDVERRVAFQIVGGREHPAVRRN